MGDRFQQLGGTIWFEARAKSLIRTDDAVTGLVVEKGAETLSIRANTVILAAGGFQNNPQLLEEHIGPSASANCVRRAVSTNVGDGLRMALEVGACHSTRMDTFYGHLMPAPPCEIDWNQDLDPTLLTAVYAQQGVVLNADGDRFVDESVSESSGLTANGAAKQPPGGAWIVLDSKIRRLFARFDLPPGTARLANLKRHRQLIKYLRFHRRGSVFAPRILVTVDGLSFAIDKGATVLESPTLEGLGQLLSENGTNGEAAVEFLKEFNAYVEDGRGASLAVPPTEQPNPLRFSPFYAIKVMPGVSMTYGGVAINRNAEVLDKHGNAIPGLLAVPGTAGGIHQLHYGGSLATAAVYGLIAAEQVLGADPSPPAGMERGLLRP